MLGTGTKPIGIGGIGRYRKGEAMRKIETTIPEFVDAMIESAETSEEPLMVSLNKLDYDKMKLSLPKSGASGLPNVPIGLFFFTDSTIAVGSYHIGKRAPDRFRDEVDRVLDDKEKEENKDGNERNGSK